MINDIVKNLEKGKNLLEILSNDVYTNKSVAPYYSSIGNHIRHILDVFNCIHEGIHLKNINFSIRERNHLIENEKANGIEYFNTIIEKLKSINFINLDTIILVTDNLGETKKTVNYTIAAALMQANSHTTHHYATIGYILYHLGEKLPNSDFGFNPTTPKKVNINGTFN